MSKPDPIHQLVAEVISDRLTEDVFERAVARNLESIQHVPENKVRGLLGLPKHGRLPKFSRVIVSERRRLIPFTGAGCRRH